MEKRKNLENKHQEVVPLRVLSSTLIPYAPNSLCHLSSKNRKKKLNPTYLEACSKQGSPNLVPQ